MILNGGSPDHVPILPSGFSILPDGPTRDGGSGSLVTMAFQILDNSSSPTYIPPESVATIFKLVTETAECIKAAMFSPSNLGTWYEEINFRSRCCMTNFGKFYSNVSPLWVISREMYRKFLVLFKVSRLRFDATWTAASLSFWFFFSFQTTVLNQRIR